MRHLWTAVLAGALLSACAEPEFPSDEELEQLNLIWGMAANPPPDTTNRVEGMAQARVLGAQLFSDGALSSCGTVSCASCHANPSLTTDHALANGCNGGVTLRNPPTLLNVAYYRWYNWDGRADRLWSQAVLPLTNPVEMASTPQTVRQRLVAAYDADYREVFGTSAATDEDSVVMSNVGKAIAAHLRTYQRAAAPFDTSVQQFLALPQEERPNHPMYLALRTFVRKGQCIACHRGPSLTDNKFHVIGVTDSGAGRRGRAAVISDILAWDYRASGPHSDDTTGADADRVRALQATTATELEELEGAFRTPTLRNVALTAPYMHTGELATLEDVVDFYDRGGEPVGTFAGVRTETIRSLGLSTAEKAALVELLKSLTGASPTP